MKIFWRCTSSEERNRGGTPCEKDLGCSGTRNAEISHHFRDQNLCFSGEIIPMLRGQHCSSMGCRGGYLPAPARLCLVGSAIRSSGDSRLVRSPSSFAEEEASGVGYLGLVSRVRLGPVAPLHTYGSVPGEVPAGLCSAAHGPRDGTAEITCRFSPQKGL